MKKKFGLWLNIVTICLCVCAIAIGVYAATSATLTVSGNIGFTAHGCDVDVNVFKWGHADGTTPDEMKDGLPIAEAGRVQISDNDTTDQDNTIKIRGASQTLDSVLGVMYFSDMNSSDGKPHDIVVDFEFTNVSLFNVMATVDLENTSCANTKVKIDYTQTSVVMDKTGGTTTTGKISFVISLLPTITNGEATYDAITTPIDIDLSIKFEKTEYTNAQTRNTSFAIKAFDEDYADEVYGIIDDAECCGTISYEETGKRNYAEAFPYYIEMGTYNKTGEAIKWLIVGVDDGNGTMQKLTDNDKAILAKGIMLASKNYYVLSEKVLEYKAFQVEYEYVNDGYINTKYGTKANDYATSEIREYLKGTEFTTKYGITEQDLTKIQERSITQMYTTDTISVVEAEETILANGQTFPSNVTGKATIDTTADKFWLLSQTEILSIFADDTVVCDSDNFKVFMSGRTAAYGASEGAAGWWLRSPYAKNTLRARGVNGGGYSGSGGVNNSGFGVRAAFKI